MLTGGHAAALATIIDGTATGLTQLRTDIAGPVTSRRPGRCAPRFAEAVGDPGGAGEVSSPA